MTDHAAQLATSDGRTALLTAKANEYAFFESLGGRSDEAMRIASRDMLRRDAVKIGFAPDEIEAAIDAAIKAASEPAGSRTTEGVSEHG